MRAHLHVHSHFSLLAGASSPRELIAAARRAGFEALALTDTNAMYGAVAFWKDAREAGLRPILGAELVAGPHRAVCLAESREGYANLCALITKRRLDETFALPHDLAARQEGLVVLSSDPATLHELKDRVADERLFAELVPREGPAPRHDPARLDATARALGLSTAATNDVWFAAREQWPLHRALLAIQRQGLIASLPPGAVAPPGAWLRPPATMRRLLADFPGALRHAGEIADRCAGWKLPLGRVRLPACDVAPGETPYSMLSKLAFEGAARRYRPFRPEVVRRLERELSVIDGLGFSPYFLIVHDIVRFCRAKDIPAAGRGSAADSLVAYALGITCADPLRHGLLFERFLTPSRTDCPDIDLDLCTRRRDEVIDYVFRKYGEEHTAMISTVVTLQLRQAFREAAKACGVPLPEVDRWSATLPHHAPGGIAETIARTPECRGLPAAREPWRSALRLAEAIEGLPRHLSVHPGGVVIAPEPLRNFTACERAAKGVLVTQLEMHQVEALGLVKMDLLGQRGLTVIHHALEEIRTERSVRAAGGPGATRPREAASPDLEAIPEDEPATGAMLADGDTIGCFQIESPGMRNLLQQLRARTRGEVIAAIALIRPGPSAGGMKDAFVRRARGLEKPAAPHPALREALAETHGIPLYQEDILRLAHRVAGFSLDEADQLRKAISRKRSPERMAALEARFLAGARGQGCSDEVARGLWAIVAGFAAYSFCKAHAVTYGILAHRIAWLKRHHPAAFFAAVLSTDGGFYAPRVYAEEAKRHGVALLLPDINRSRTDCTVEVDGTAGAIRLGLARVQGLRAAAIEALLAARRAGGPFLSLADLCRRVPALAQAEIEDLILCGALDGMDHTRPELLWRLHDLFPKIDREARERREQLFPTSRAPLSPGVFPRLPDYPLPKRVALELELLGAAVSAHPLQAAAPALLDDPSITPSIHLKRHAGARVAVAGWLVTTRRARTARGATMKFATLEDPLGTIEATLFPAAYARWGGVLRGYGPYRVEGIVESHHGAVTLRVEAIRRVEGKERIEGATESTRGGLPPSPAA